MKQKDTRITGVRDFEKNKQNPFLSQAFDEIVKGTRTRMKFGHTPKKNEIMAVMKYNEVGQTNGEIVEFSQFMKMIRVDETKFTKIYLSKMQAFFELGQEGVRVFTYFSEKVKPKTDYVIFEIDECMEHCKYANRNSVYRGLTQLLRAGIIARSNNDTIYFINPLVMFNGDRITFMETYIKNNGQPQDKNQLTLEANGHF